MAGAPTIGLVGPTRPYRSGIAQHTTDLHRALSRRGEVVTISFARQYPLWLYPGRSNMEPGRQRREPGIHYLLDPLRPLTWSAAAKRLERVRVEAVVLPWWSVFWAPLTSYLARRLRGNGIRVVFIGHNVVDHEGTRWKSLLSESVLARGHAVLVHSREDADWISSRLPELRLAVHPHPIFEELPPPGETLARRAPLELLCFGVVRAYKGVDVLADAMDRLDTTGRLDTTDLHLTVAGEWWLKDSALKKRLERMPNVEVIDDYLPATTVAELFTRADLAVLPYRSASGTGVIPVAYRYGTPVLATRVGGLPDMVVPGETGFLVAPEEPGALAREIERFATERPDLSSGIEAMSRRLSWDGLVEALLELL